MSDNSHAAMCIYCGETVIYDIRQVTDMAAAHEQLMAHDQKCAKNPIVAERDALAAHVDVMERRGDQMAIELRDWLGSYGPDDETERMLEVWEDAKSRRPQTSLARRDAEVIASLRFPIMLRKMWSGGEVQQWLDNQAEGKRIQAEEGRE